MLLVVVPESAQAEPVLVVVPESAQAEPVLVVPQGPVPVRLARALVLGQVAVGVGLELEPEFVLVPCQELAESVAPESVRALAALAGVLAVVVWP